MRDADAHLRIPNARWAKEGVSAVRWYAMAAPHNIADANSTACTTRVEVALLTYRHDRTLIYGF